MVRVGELWTAEVKQTKQTAEERRERAKKAREERHAASVRLAREQVTKIKPTSAVRDDWCIQPPSLARLMAGR